LNFERFEQFKFWVIVAVYVYAVMVHFGSFWLIPCFITTDCCISVNLLCSISLLKFITKNSEIFLT